MGASNKRMALDEGSIAASFWGAKEELKTKEGGEG